MADEREFLRHSIEDLEDERASGEVDEEDFAVLRSRYSQRLAEVEAAIDASASAEIGSDATRAEAGEVEAEGGLSGQSAPPGKRFRRRLGNRRVRLVIGIAAAACFVVAATLLAASLSGVRLPGESATGSVSLSTAQQEQETLDRASILGSEGQAAEAVQLYNQVLKTDPDQPDALTYGGWLIRLAGLSSKKSLVLAEGDASVARAVKVAPGYPDGHALLGVILYEDFGRAAAAAVQFRDALSAGASKNLLASVAEVAVKSFAAAEQSVPPPYTAALKSPATGTRAG
jgi:tetratricopeptide (TPR) repeat protein